MLTLKIQHLRFDEVQVAIDRAAQGVIPDIATAIAQDASYKAPVDTGSEERGFYIVTKDRDTYNDAVGAATGVNPHVQILDHIAQTADSYHGYVSHAPEHTLYQELGTAHMAPQPALIPAAEAHRRDFVETLAAAVSAAIGEVLR